MSTAVASLRTRILHAGGWVTLGFAYSQLLRLAGNLVLTRLLIPEYFGIMAIAQAVMTGLALFSDVGITQSIVYNERGSREEFVNTAWSLQILRGVALWLITLVLAWPLSRFYGEPILRYLLPFVGINALLSGFASTNVAVADRTLSLARVTLIDTVTGTLGLMFSVVWALLYPSVWALLAGGLVSSLTRAWASHVYLPGVRNRWLWHPPSAHSLLTFGRWIFLSSALTFFAGEGNRLLIGKLLDVRLLAFFSVANGLAAMGSGIVQTIGGRVMFPAYAEVARERPEQLYRVVLLSRASQSIPLAVLSVGLALGGGVLVDVLYDHRYHDAGWMLQLLSLGGVGGAVLASYGGVFWAIGQARASSILLGIQVAIQLTGMWIGGHYGAAGLVGGIALTGWLMYPAYAITAARFRIWQPVLDLPILLAGVVTAVPVLRHVVG